MQIKLNYFVAIIAGLIVILFLSFLFGVLFGIKDARADELPFTDENCIRAIIGEASGEGFFGMKCLACAIINRNSLQGVYGTDAKHMAKEPAWVWQMARTAYYEAKTGIPIHDGSFWGSKTVDKAWIAKMERKGFVLVYEYKNHRFYKAKQCE